MDREDVSSKRLRTSDHTEIDESRLVPIMPPLRFSRIGRETETVGHEAAADAVPTVLDRRFARVLFRIKTDPMKESPKCVVSNAALDEGFHESYDINLKADDSTFVLDILADDILIGRGMGKTLEEAEIDAYEDFVERCVRCKPSIGMKSRH